MRLIKFNKLETKDYNYVNRHLQKAGFKPRKVAWIIFVKAIVMHSLQKKSWRYISKIFNVNHIILHTFYKNYTKNNEILKILHLFVDRWIIVYLGENEAFSYSELTNSSSIINLTKKKLEISLM